MYDNVRIVVVLLLMLGGIMMIYYFRHDMESQCCQAVKKLNQQAALAMAGDSKYMIAGEVRNRGLLQNISYVDTGIRLPTE
jgi:hypothetical protein